MQQFASVVEYASIATLASYTFASGEPFRCFGTVVASTSGNAVVEFTDIEGNAIFTFFEVSNLGCMKLPFYADKGMIATVTSASTVNVTVFRTQPGS